MTSDHQTARDARPSAPHRLLHRLRAWLSAQREFGLDYAIIISVFVIIYVALILVRDQYFPDSAFYLARGLWYSGMSQQEAFEYVLQRNLDNGYAPNTDINQLFNWGLVSTRVVLPILSVPFIWLFGPDGMAVVAGIATFVLVIMLYKFLAKHYGRVASVVAVLLMMSSMSIMISNVAMLTESFSALWGVIALMLAYRYQRDGRWRWIIALVVITTISAFTRQATFIVAGAFVVAWALSLFSSQQRGKWGWPALATAATALILQVVQTVIAPFSQEGQFQRMTGTDSLLGALQATPALIVRVFRKEFADYVVDDQVLVVFLVLCAISMVVFWRRTESHLLLGALIGIALYNITNGNATHFRYAIPGLVFFLASISLLVSQVQAQGRANRSGSANDLEIPTAALPHS